MKERGIVAINYATGEKKVFSSTNEAARFLGVQFQSVQIAVARGGMCKGWKVYPTPENIKQRIELLKKQLEIVES